MSVVFEWMERCAEAIAGMKFNPETFEADVARKIAEYHPRAVLRKKRYGDRGKGLREARIANGLCWRCGDPGHKRNGKRLRVCAYHAKLDRERYWDKKLKGAA